MLSIDNIALLSEGKPWFAISSLFHSHFPVELITTLTVLGYSSFRCSSSSDWITVISGAKRLPFSAISSSFLVSTRPQQRPKRQYTNTHTTLLISFTCTIHTRVLHSFDRSPPVCVFAQLWPKSSCLCLRSDVVMPHFYQTRALSLLSRSTVSHWLIPFVLNFLHGMR